MSETIRYEAEVSKGLAGAIVTRVRRGASGKWVQALAAPAAAREYLALPELGTQAIDGMTFEEVAAGGAGHKVIPVRRPYYVGGTRTARIVRIGFEVEAGAQVDPIGAIERGVDLKWSLWSADPGVWSDYAPEVLKLIRSFIKGGAPRALVVETAPRKETRSGCVSFLPITGGRFEIQVRFRSEWDEPSDLLDTLGLEDEDEDSLREALPFADGEPGVEVEASKTFRYGARLATVLKWIDAREDDLLAQDERAWKEIEGAYKK